MPTPLDPELVDQIRASLYSGRGVRLSGNDAPTTMLEPSTELTAEGDAFLTGKLDKIAELLDRGFVVNIDSQGAILAATPDHRSRYISTQETEIDVMDRLMIKQALEQGSKVSFEPDGSLVIDAVPDGAAPSAEVAAARFAEFERLADSGQINGALADGLEYQFDESVVPMTVVQNAAPLDDPFDTAAELEAEAAALQLGVDAARDLSLPEFSANKLAAENERMAAERRLAMTTTERDSAERQAAAASAEAMEMAEAAANKRAEAADARAGGEIAAAAAIDADAANFEAMAALHAGAADNAREVLDAAEGRLAEETAAVDRLTVASDEVNQEASRLETVLDEQEGQVFYAEKAAAELAEAERLEAALPDLQARGVEGTERIEAAIAEHRAQAEALVQKGHLRDTTGITVTGDDITGDDITGDDITSNDIMGDDIMGDDMSGDDIVNGDDAPTAVAPSEDVPSDDDAAAPDELAPAAEIDAPEATVEDPLPADLGVDGTAGEFAPTEPTELPEPIEELSDFQDDLGDAQQLESAADSVFDGPMDL